MRDSVYSAVAASHFGSVASNITENARIASPPLRCVCAAHFFNSGLVSLSSVRIASLHWCVRTSPHRSLARAREARHSSMVTRARSMRKFFSLHTRARASKNFSGGFNLLSSVRTLLSRNESFNLRICRRKIEEVGKMTATLGQDEILQSTRTVCQGLEALKEEHESIRSTLLTSAQALDNDERRVVEDKSRLLSKNLDSIQLGIEEAHVRCFLLFIGSAAHRQRVV